MHERQREVRRPAPRWRPAPARRATWPASLTPACRSKMSSSAPTSVMISARRPGSPASGLVAAAARRAAREQRRRRRSPARPAAASAGRPGRGRAARRSRPTRRATRADDRRQRRRSRPPRAAPAARASSAGEPSREESRRRAQVGPGDRGRPRLRTRTHARSGSISRRSAHPIVLRPIVAAAARGRATRSRSPRATTRRRWSCSRGCTGSSVEVSARHGGATRTEQARRAGRRARRDAARAGREGATSTSRSRHGSNDLALVAPRARDPGGQHVRLRVGDGPAQHRLPAGAAGDGARRDPARAPAPLRRRRRTSSPSTRGSRRSTTSRTSSPTAACSPRWASTRDAVLVVVRPPPDVSLYHRKSNPLFPQVLEHIGRDAGVHAVVLPRTEPRSAQYVRGSGCRR